MAGVMLCYDDDTFTACLVDKWIGRVGSSLNHLERRCTADTKYLI